LLTTISCQQTPPVAPQQPDADAAAAQQLLAEVMQQFQKEGIQLDSKAQTVTITAVVNQSQDPVEYLLIHKRGKRHEAMFWTNSKPSVLNAALLMLGLQPGKNASYVEKDPPPTLEEIDAGADPIVVTEPSGTPLWLTVKWQDADGKQVEHDIEDLILDLTTQQPVVDASFVYLGGRMAQIYRGEPEVFVADFEGNLISTCYMTPDNHLGTMVHKDARDDQNWWMTSLMPEPGTEVSFVFHRQEPVLHKERMARLQRERKAAEAAPKGADAPTETPK
jgi:hypothetical protein